MLIEFIRWWYGFGWLEAWRTAGKWVINTQRAFSVGVLAKTLFSPWKQIVALPGRSLDEKFKGVIDNLISRTIGFFARLTALIAAAVLMVLVAIAGFAIAIAWPVIPLAFFYFVFRAVSG